MSGDEITFYDVATALGPFATNPNCWKTRLCLNYKGLKYKTVFVKYKDIQATSKAMDAKPASTYADNGEIRYTLPAIQLPSGEAIADSLVIAKKLDEVHPEQPIFGSEEAFRAAEASVQRLWDDCMVPSFTLFCDGFDILLDQESIAYFRGRPAAGIPHSPALGTPEREQMWVVIRAGWEKFKEHLDGKQQNLFVDFAIVAHLLCVQHFLSKEEWDANYAKWDDGRWVELVAEYNALTKRDNY